MKLSNSILNASLVTLAMLAATSCKAPKDVAYFQDTETTAIIDAAQVRNITVRPEDKLSIVIKTKDPEISNLFNLPIYSSRIGQTSGSVNGSGTKSLNFTANGNDGVATYTVNPQGDIDFPVLGKLHVAGMTRSELASFIKGEIEGRDLAKDPVVTVEFLGSGINMMGEVMSPGRYDLNKDKINIIEAITLAGDLTINGRRDNVRVIREENGKVNTYFVNLTDLDSTVKSPAYYLQQNDIIYVEPNNKRKRETSVNGNNVYSTSFWISVASLVTSAVSTIGVLTRK